MLLWLIIAVLFCVLTLMIRIVSMVTRMMLGHLPQCVRNGASHMV